MPLPKQKAKTIDFGDRTFASAMILVDQNGNFYAADGNNIQNVKLLDTDGNPYTVQNPLPANGHSIHVPDIDFTNSDFIEWSGDPENLFKSPFSQSITNSTANNPKRIVLAFNRTVKALQVGFGENNGGSFSNLKVSLLGSGGATRSVFDSSLDNVKRTSLNAIFENELFNSLLIEFYTADAVSLSNITIQKSAYNTVQVQGQDPSGNFRYQKTNDSGNPIVAITPQDIFGNIPISEQFSLWDNSRVFSYSVGLFWTDYLNGAGATNTYDKATSKNTLAVAANGEIAATQLKQRSKYQPLKAHKAAFTGVFTQEAGIEKYVGLADLDNYGDPAVDGTIYNGVVFKITEGNIYCQIHNNGVLIEEAQQDDWNIDKLNGLGQSGYILDLTKAQIGVTELEWLGVGAVLIIMNIDGKNIPIHMFKHSNNSVADVYMRTANLPIMYMIKSIGGSGSMKVICNAIVSGGGHNPVGVHRVAETNTPIAVASGTEEALVFIRLKPEGYEGTVNVRGFAGIVASSGDCIFRLLFNPTWSGTQITWSDVPNSHVQIATAEGDNVITDRGIVAEYQPLSSDSDAFSFKSDSKLKLGKNLQINANQEGRYDVYCLSALSLNTSEVYEAAILYEDVF